MIPYYSPNFSIVDLIKSLACRNEEQRIVEYFKKLTGKEYILITSSCRSALYLTYKSLGKRGVVYTSPLTCKVALTPVAQSGNKIGFIDIKKDDWTIDPDKLSEVVNTDGIAIQAIHFGGFPCAMDKLRQIADDNGLLLVEDCAQGFGALYKDNQIGRLSDVACFTLCKNVYGIGGGILATDSQDIYEKAKNEQLKFPQENKLKIAYRMSRHILESITLGMIITPILKMTTFVKKRYTCRNEQEKDVSLEKELKRPPEIYAKSVACRVGKIEILNEKRRKNAKIMINKLKTLGFEFQENKDSSSSYTKLYCYHEKIESKSFISMLNANGIEAKHLEHKEDVFYQEKAINDESLKEAIVKTKELTIYEDVHDKLISLPLLEKNMRKQVEKMYCLLKKETV